MTTYPLSCRAQKFRFCGERDCPDWLLAEIVVLTKLVRVAPYSSRPFARNRAAINLVTAVQYLSMCSTVVMGTAAPGGRGGQRRTRICDTVTRDPSCGGGQRIPCGPLFGSVAARVGLAIGEIVGLTVGPAVGLMAGLVAGLLVGLIVGLAVELMAELVMGLRVPVVQRPDCPPPPPSPAPLTDPPIHRALTCTLHLPVPPFGCDATLQTSVKMKLLVGNVIKDIIGTSDLDVRIAPHAALAPSICTCVGGEGGRERE